MGTAHFADRLMAAITGRKSRVCVGLDPQPGRLPDGVDTRRFCERIIEAVAPYAACVKPNAAFFEVLGPHGVGMLGPIAEKARALGLAVILDAKRGDIGSTATAYAQAYLGPDSPFDAITINPYLGSDGVRPFIECAAGNGKGIFVLVKTSNRSSGELQDLVLESGLRVYEQMADLVAGWGRGRAGESGYSLVGAVVGATYPQQLARLRRRMPRSPLLVPGYGAQGAGAADVGGAFNADGLGAVVNSSRGIIYAYEQAEYAGLDFAEAATEATRRMREELNEETIGRHG